MCFKYIWDESNELKKKKLKEKEAVKILAHTH